MFLQACFNGGISQFFHSKEIGASAHEMEQKATEQALVCYTCLLCFPCLFTAGHTSV